MTKGGFVLRSARKSEETSGKSIRPSENELDFPE
jgi:hypothetical protein